MPSGTKTEEQLPDAVTEAGKHLRVMAAASPVLLVFLRHWGCPFCRQSLSDLAGLRQEIESTGVLLMFVHMGTPERARPYFEHYGLATAERISDPEQALYRHPVFALPRRASLSHLFDRRVIQAFLRGVAFRQGMGVLQSEDMAQMPGVFVLRDGVIVRSFRYRSIADKPDFLAMITDCRTIGG